MQCTRPAVCIYHRFTCWSLLYSAVLRSWANSLRLHVILHEWTAFYSTSVLNIHRSGVLTVLVLLVPHKTDTISARYVYTIQPCTMSLHAKPHAHLAVTCHLHFQQNDQGLLHATVVTPGWNEYQIRVITQSWPWRRKLSHHSCRDSNPQPFYHEPNALTTELSPPYNHHDRVRRAKELGLKLRWSWALIAGWIVSLPSCSSTVAFLDTVFVTVFHTAIERASCRVHNLPRTGRVPTSITLFW